MITCNANTNLFTFRCVSIRDSAVYNEQIGKHVSEYSLRYLHNNTRVSMPCVRDIFLPGDSSITQIKQIYCCCSLGSRLVVIILELSRPIVWLVRHVCSDKAKFSFLLKKPLFDALSNMYQTDVWSVRCIRCHSHCNE